MKKPLIISGAIAATLVLLALIVPNFVDWSRYRTEVADAVEKFTGRQVEIGEKLSFRLLLTPALSASDIRLSNFDGGRATNMIELDSLDVKVNLFSLLTGQLEVSSIVLINPRIALERDINGRGNWEFSTGDEEGEASGSKGPRLRRFVIEGGSLSYYDAASGDEYALGDVSAVISADSVAGPFDVSGSMVFRDVPVVFEVKTAAVAETGETPVRANVVLAGQTPSLEFTGGIGLGEQRSVNGRLQGRGSNFGAFVGSLARLADSDLSVPLNLAHPYDVDIRIEGDGTDTSLALEAVTVAGSGIEGVVAVSLAGKIPTLNIEAEVNTVKLDDWLPQTQQKTPRAQPKAAAEPFSLPSDVAAAADITISAVEYRDGVMRQLRMAGQMADGTIHVDDARALLPGGSDVVISGDLKAERGEPVFNGHVRAGSNNLRGLLNWLEVDTSGVADGQLTTFSLSGAVRATPQIAQLQQIKAAIDITEAEGTVGVRLAERPSYDVKLQLGRINADAYRKAPPDQKLDWATIRKQIEDALRPLAEIDATMEIGAEQVTFAGANIANARLEGVLKDGTLDLARLSAGSFEAVRIFTNGRITGLDKSPNFNLSIDIESPNLQRILRWAEYESPVPPAALARTALKGSVRGNLDNVDVDLTGSAAEGDFTIAGELAGLSPAPQSFDVTLTASHPDHRDLIKRLQLELEIKGTAAPVRASGAVKGTATDFSGNLRVEALGGRADIQGSVKGAEGARSFNASATAQHGEMAGLVRAFVPDFRPSRQQLGPINVVLGLAGDEKNFAVNKIDATLGPSQVQGNLKFENVDQRPRVTGVLTAGAIPLDAYMRTPVAGAQEATLDGGERWSRRPFALEGLRDFDANVQLSAQAIGYREYVYVKPRLTIDLKDSLLSIRGMQAGLFNGQARLNAALDVKDVPALNMDINIDGASAAEMTRVMAFYAPLHGTLKLDGRFAAVGNSQFEMVSALNGTLNMLARDGKINGVDIPRFSQRLQTLRSLPDFLTLVATLASGVGSTPYRTIAAEQSIVNGVITLDKLTADIDGADLTGAGNINLPQWTIELGGNIRLTGFPEAPPIGYEKRGPVHSAKTKFHTRQLRSFMLNRMLVQNPDGAAQGEQPTQDQQGQTGGLLDLLGGGLQPAPPETTTTPDNQQTKPAPKPEEELVKGLINLLGKKKEQPKDKEEEKEPAPPR